MPSQRRRTITPSDSAEAVDQTAAAPRASGGLRRIPISQIDVPPARIRRELGNVEDLAYSVGSVGLLHPVHVYRVRNRYRLIAGERRLVAARSLGWTDIDAVVREASDDHLLLELVENTQRKWLTDVEEADALIRLIRELGHDAKEVAAQAGRSEAYVSKRVRVFEDPNLRKAIESDQMSVSVAEEFLAVPAKKRAPLVERAISENWDGRQAREAARAILAPPPPADTEEEDFDYPESGSVRGLSPNERSANLTSEVRALNHELQSVRAVELTDAEVRALAQLLQTLLRLARAHARGAGRGATIFPSLEEAERTVRRRP